MIEKAFGGEPTKPPENANKFSQIRYNIWQFLEDPNYSKAAKVNLVTWSGIRCMMRFCGIIVSPLGKYIK